MNRLVLTVTAALLGCVAPAGCSASTPDAASAPAATTGAAVPSADTTTTAPTPTTTGSAHGMITFKGSLSGSMGISGCEGGMAQLVVTVDGEDTTSAGLIDADDFTFVVPHSTGYTLADGASKPTVSGSTYTVANTKLVSITNDDTVTANGSVTCP